MKAVKKIILIIISFFIIGIKVEGSTNDTGICYKKKAVATGYCELNQNVNISREQFGNQPLVLTNGSSPSRYNYFGIVEGIERDMFCIDSNLPEPGSQPYKYARSFDIQTDYDRAIAKVYAGYMNDVVYAANRGSSLDVALETYKQAANVAMRAITIKYGYDIINGSVYSNHFDNIYKQFEGKTAPNPKLVETSDAYKTARKYYCSAIISCKKCDIARDALSVCQNVSGVTSGLHEFNFKFDVDANQIENGSLNRNKIERRVPVKITGLGAMYIQAYEITNPSFYINSVKCENNKLSCTLEDSSLPTTNLVQKNRNEYTFYVKVSGSVDDIKNITNTRILIDYKYNHILDSNNLAVLRYHLTEQYRQRMIIFMPMREQNADVSLVINNPTVCERRNGEFYYAGAKIANISTYLRKGCCDVEYNELTSESDRQYYINTCAANDIVNLDYKCDNDGNPNDMSESTVKQVKTIDTIEKLIKEYESSGNNTKLKQLDKNNLDDRYISSGNDVESTYFDSSNTFCKLYTTEDQNIYFPGTTEATSGRFFVFDNQPRVEGTINALFYTDYDRWKRDYDAAILDEKNKYDDWQVASAVENAQNQLSECQTVPNGQGGVVTCGCCPPPGVAMICYTPCNVYYTGTNTKHAPSRTYYRANGSDLGNVYATRSCGCGAGSFGNVYTSLTSKGRETDLKKIYERAVTHRENLEKYKEQCESRSKIASKWKYYLEPDLKFTYKQIYYNPDTNSVQDLVTEVPMKVSWTSEKYWPNISTQPQQLSSEGEYKGQEFEVKYGGHNYKDGETKEFDTTKIYTTGYTQTLYYIPTEKYFSLLPDGQYVTSRTMYQGLRQYVDVGYVFNVEITNFTNEYYTWFSIDKIGHLMRNPRVTPKLDSNIQKSVNATLTKINDQTLLNIYRNENMDQSMFNNVCYYNNEEIIYKNDCVDCSDERFKPQYFTRSVATDNIFPNAGASGRETGANWTNAKGKTVRDLIQSIGDEIYSDTDGSKGYLEASIILTPTRMLEIKKNYQNYQDFDTITCNQYAKECLSALLTKWAQESGTSDILANAREYLWKYYANGIIQKGKMKNILPNGAYPEEDAKLPSWP